MTLKDINFGDVDAKNEILKDMRSGTSHFFDSFSIPSRIRISEFETGQKYFVLGLKGTGKTALLRYIHNSVLSKNNLSELVLFKSHVTEEDRQKLSTGAGFELIGTEGVPNFIQDFKESWKWLIYQKLANLIKSDGVESEPATKLYKLTSVSENKFTSTLGALFSKVSTGKVKFAGEAIGIAFDLGIDVDNSKESADVSLSNANRACGSLLNEITSEKAAYLFFDELELFFETKDQFDRDRRIIRDLVYAISQINGESAENGRKIFLISSLRTEVLHSILELGHEIGRDIDDFGESLHWSDARNSAKHPLLELIAKKISASSGVKREQVWNTFFPQKINNQNYYSFILNSSYYRPRDIVRLLRIARSYDPDANKFSSVHFDETSREYSKQTWLEITEELLASYSPVEIAALQKFLLGFNTHFFKYDITNRLEKRYRDDRDIQALFDDKGIDRILDDLFRIGVLGNDFVARSHGKSVRRFGWIFRGNVILNSFERMAIHKSLWKHLTMIQGGMDNG